MPLIPALPVLNQAEPDALSAELDSGDLVLFSGVGLSSDVVRMLTRSCWSHIGVVVRHPAFQEPLILEATTVRESEDVRLGRRVTGVTLVSFQRKVLEYSGWVAVRRRSGPALSVDQRQSLNQLVDRFLDRPYRNYVFAQVSAALPWVWQRGLFCSELVAEVYRHLGWLVDCRRATSFVPGHFGCASLPLREGSLQDPVLVKGLQAGWAQTEYA